MKVAFVVDNLDELSMAQDCLKDFFDNVPYDVTRNIVEAYKPFSHNNEVLFRCKITTDKDGVIVEKQQTR